jgi:hypothetical protein
MQLNLGTMCETINADLGRKVIKLGHYKGACVQTPLPFYFWSSSTFIPSLANSAQTNGIYSLFVVAAHLDSTSIFYSAAVCPMRVGCDTWAIYRSGQCIFNGRDITIAMVKN